MLGKTCDKPHRRLAIHKKSALHPNAAGHKVYSAKWLRTVYAAGLKPEMEILEVVPPGGDWIEAEQFWIAYWKSLGCRLTNLSIGGEGQEGIKRHPSFGAHMSAISRGRKMSEEAKQKMRDAWTPERKASHALYASTVRKYSADALERILAGQRKRWERYYSC